jgi:phospholipid/cholesterol/gamma-HCH transport system ATP-binding protein
MTQSTPPGAPDSAAAANAAPVAATDDRTAAVEVRGLRVAYGDTTVLHDIDLTVRAGEIMVIMGGSGSGKSTLLNTLLGLLRPTAGEVRLLGQDITRMKERELGRLRQRMGVAFQGGALFSSLNVGENIMLPLREHTRLDEETMRIMARMKMEVVDLGGREGLMPAELSGGMVKRAALARAIVMDPQLLFCDEPSAGLDPVVAKQIDRLILDLRAAFDMTVIVVTHELDSAFDIADRICVLDRGQVRIVDTVENVRQADDQRVQDLLNRRAETVEVDPDAYLSRLTSDIL